MNNLVAFIRQHIRAALGRPLQVGVIYIGAATLALFGLAFLLMAAQNWLTLWCQSPIEADLIIAGGLAVLAIVIAIVGETVRRAPAPEIATPVSLAVAVPIAMRIAPKLLNAKALGIASVILGGLLIGREFAKK